jgi:prepilin-type N-terminal cleavage/methylation domain-containing protein
MRLPGKGGMGCDGWLRARTLLFSLRRLPLLDRNFFVEVPVAGPLACSFPSLNFMPRFCPRAHFMPARRAFTVTELMVVVTVMAILLGISFNLTRSVTQQGLVAKARNELAGVGQALALYKLQFGDFPSTDQERELYAALTGKLGPGADRPKLPSGGKIFLNNMSLYTLEKDIPPTYVADNMLMDPWGNPYHFAYKPGSGAWNSGSYVLYSDGPDRKSKKSSIYTGSGILQPEATKGDNLDNIYEPSIK